MHIWRHYNWHKLASVVLLLVLLGQSALLLHEIGHTNAVADTECQLCLHAQPNLSPDELPLAPTAYLARISVVDLQVEQPVYFSPIYANSSRGPPRA